MILSIVINTQIMTPNVRVTMVVFAECCDFVIKLSVVTLGVVVPNVVAFHGHYIHVSKWSNVLQKKIMQLAMLLHKLFPAVIYGLS
jgi:hypothetical protein